MKRILSLVLLVLGVFLITGCGSTKESESKNISGSLSDIMTKLYEGIDEDKLPKMLETHELTEENFEYYAFSKDIDYKEAVFSESMTGSIAHSVVLIRLNKDSDSKSVVSEIKENANPNKWICATAKNVYVESNGDLVVLIMTDNEDNDPDMDIADAIKNNFNNLK